VGALQWGASTLTHVLVVTRPLGTYEKNMSDMLGAPIVGSLGGNVFRSFRIEIDYPAGKLYLAQAPHAKPDSLDMVGVMLEPALGGGYDVAMVQGDAGGIAVGDHLLAVGALDATQARFQALRAALSGKPGETRVLTVERDGKTLTLKAPVRHLMGAGD
jgi:hypothetical protein